VQSSAEAELTDEAIDITEDEDNAEETAEDSADETAEETADDASDETTEDSVDEEDCATELTDASELDATLPEHTSPDRTGTSAFPEPVP